MKAFAKAFLAVGLSAIDVYAYQVHFGGAVLLAAAAAPVLVSAVIDFAFSALV